VSLTVIITSYNALEYIENCLRSLGSQQTTHRFEVMLVDSSQDGTVALAVRCFPQIRLITHPSRLYCGSARNLAFPLACAPRVAFLDADCVVPPDWVEQILGAPHQALPIVGGSIENGSPHRLAAWAYYFCEFSLWMPSAEDREIREVAGCCLSFDKRLFEEYGPFQEGSYCSDTLFLRKLCRAGFKIRFLPGIRVWHTFNGTVLSFLKHQFEQRRWHGRVCFPPCQHASLRQWLYWISLPFHPLFLLIAVTWRLRYHPAYALNFLRSLPLVTAGFFARVLGELAALLESRP
jgi:GT2 family glycosyltransferase